MKKVFIVIVLIIIVASFAGTGYFLYSKSVEPEVVFETDTPFYTDIVKKTVAVGSITPRKEVDVKSQVSGVVEDLYKEPGDIAKTGDLIAKIKIIPDVVALNNAEARVKEALINFKNAEKELTRQRDLYEQEAISEFSYNQFVLDYNLRKQQLDAARDNLDLVKEGASKKSGVASNLVRATASGMILDISVKEGTFVIESNTFNDGTTIASIANMGKMIFEGKVDESEVGKIKEGMDLVLQVGALEEERFEAVLEYISPKGVEEEGAIQFEIRAAMVENPDGSFLRAGYSANADIVLDERDSVLAIKESNLIFDKDGTIYVEVEVGPQQFERRAVKTGLSDGVNIEVLEGLSIDTKVKKQ